MIIIGELEANERGVNYFGKLKENWPNILIQWVVSTFSELIRKSTSCLMKDCSVDELN
jgi:hypothetical protein